MHEFEIMPQLEKIIIKLSKKDKLLYSRILKKIDEIANSYDVESYKNLRYDAKECKRVHIGHFVLIFRFDKKNDLQENSVSS